MAANDGAKCPVCGGTGWTVERRDGRELAVRCACRREREREALLRASRIPARYLGCTIDGFEVWDPSDPTLSQARRRTRDFVDSWGATPPERGLLYMGAAGCGKTHLAVAALRELVVTKGVRGLYVNFLELVQQLQMTFDGGGRNREDVLSPPVEAEALVLDELGAGKLSPWVMDLLYYVINSRYMSKRVTLCTTTYSDFAGASGSSQTNRVDESLTDRISAPLRSRLYEMCELVDIRCGDYRARRAGGRGRAR
jgi:DNA replication protein DnaC